MRVQCLLLVALCFALTSTASKGQEASQPVLKMYPVSDIVLQVADYPYPGEGARSGLMGGFGGGGGGMGGGFGGGGGMGGGGGAFQVGRDEGGDSYSTAITVDELVQAIQTFVDPDSWNEQGELQVLGGALVVKQTPENHDLIAELLKEIRSSLGNRRTVSIDARWLLLSSDDLDALLDKENTAESTLLASRKQLDDHMRESSSLRAITHCFSGQKIYVVSGSKQNVVSGYIPVVGALEVEEELEPVVSRDGRVRAITVQHSEGMGPMRSESKVGYQPIVEKPNLGVLLELRPTLVGGEEQFAIVDLKSTLSFSAAGAALPIQPMGNGLAPQVDRVKIETAELATTLRVPLGKPVIVGGLTQRPGQPVDASVDGADAQEAKQIYLILEVR
jgi:hypothetical protein